ncbi:hypothetical protein [[Phormidium] sp. LEGE 05292]|nr:hypothetical protein [Phormidium sp. LEGE 05292]
MSLITIFAPTNNSTAKLSIMLVVLRSTKRKDTSDKAAKLSVNAQ